MTDAVRIALVLKREHRTSGGVARVRLIAATLGINVTGTGEVAVSGSVSAELCRSLFGPVDSGRTPSIPEPLRELVESVSVFRAV